MSRLDMKSAFIGKVADDQMGRYILQYLRDNGIGTSNIITDRTGAVTGLAFTEIKSPEDCSILMYRDNVADLLLEPAEVDESLIAASKVLLVSGTALAKSPSREAVLLALRYARKHGTKVVFDIDYRPYTWHNPQETAIYYHAAAEKSDIIIGTREEFDMLEQFDGKAERSDEVTAAQWFDHYAEIVVIKHGKDGSIAYARDGSSHRGSIFPAKVIKTFGAGDSYAAGFIFGLMKGWSIRHSMEFGSACASIVISSHSCSDAMPTFIQVEEFMRESEEA